jgi:non-ribosomal peptide synthetase component E (peptide arylation enzyme)
VTQGSALLRDMVTTPERRARYEDSGLWDSSTLAARVATHAREQPDAVAVVVGDERRTFAELAGRAGSLAAALTAHGVAAGSVVSIQLPNCYEFAVAAVAVQSLGAVINPLLPNYRQRELHTVFTVAEPAVIITPAEYRGTDHRDLVAAVMANSGVNACHLVVGEPGARAAAFDDWCAGPPSELAPGEATAVSELIFTSGTEARPKAIMHTEQTTNFSVRVARSDLGITADDVVWMPSPLGHSTGFNYGLRFALYHGLRLVLQDRWNGDAAAELVAREGCTYTMAATTFLRELTEAAGRARIRLDSLRFFGCGGATVPPALVEQAQSSGIDVLRLYGSTEVLVGSWNRPHSSAAQKRGTDGTAMSFIEMEVKDDDGRPVASGEPGELYVRGPDTCVGFFDDPERTAATFGPDGWVRSGDMVTMDPDGYLTVVGRKKEIIIRGGLNITPREIEEMLTAFPEVHSAAVIGLPDPRLGERMCACVVLRDGLATYKWPERLEILEALPMTASGKVQKHELVRILGTDAPDGVASPGGTAGPDGTASPGGTAS